MSISTLDQKKFYAVVGTMTGLLITMIAQAPSSEAGVISKTTPTNLAAGAISAAAGAAVAASVAGAIGGPAGSAATAAGAATGFLAGRVTYEVTTQAIKHPVAATQTAQVLNPMTGPVYIATHPIAVASGAKQVFNYLFR